MGFLVRYNTKHLEDGRVIGMGEALDLDCTLASVADLPPGWSAWREDRIPEDRIIKALACCNQNLSAGTM